MDNGFLLNFVYLVYMLFTNCLPKILEWSNISKASKHQTSAGNMERNVKYSRKCTKWDPNGEICKICIKCRICKKAWKYAKYAYLCKCIFWPSLIISTNSVTAYSTSPEEHTKNGANDGLMHDTTGDHQGWCKSPKCWRQNNCRRR